MRALVLFVACFILGASALPTYTPKGATRSRDLEKLFDLFVRSSLARSSDPTPYPPAPTPGDSDGDSDEDQFQCDDNSAPCPGEGDDFFECAFKRLRDIEDDIIEMVNNTFGEELFREEEQDIIWELRSDWKLSIEMKEIVEVIFLELVEARFMKLDYDIVDSDTFMNSINDLVCDYIWLREKTFENGKYYHDQ